MKYITYESHNEVEYRVMEYCDETNELNLKLSFEKVLMFVFVKGR